MKIIAVYSENHTQRTNALWSKFGVCLIQRHVARTIATVRSKVTTLVFTLDSIYTSTIFCGIPPHPFFSVATAKHDGSENELK